MMVTADQSFVVEAMPGPTSLLRFAWLELTGQCNLACTHCYANSSPSGTHGELKPSEWETIISEVKHAGAETVQFIGGEPTIHPYFCQLVRFAHGRGLQVEVFTNLLRVTADMWKLFDECDVHLATSFYSSRPEVHDRVTTRVGSQKHTLGNIQTALSRGRPVRVGLIKALPEQDVAQTETFLRSLGIDAISIDHVRGLGRGTAHHTPSRPVDALCGQCGGANVAVDPDGWVYPCVFARWLKIGNVQRETFTTIMASNEMQEVKMMLNAEFEARIRAEYCPPTPLSCPPQRTCPPRCVPLFPIGPQCIPQVQCSPNCPPSVGTGIPPRPPGSCPPRA